MDIEKFLTNICGINLDLVRKIMQVVNTIEKINDTILKIIGIFLTVEWGMVPKDLLMAAAAVATQIAGEIVGNLMGRLSAAAASILNAILAPLVKLILVFPESLISLIRIPQDSAIEAAVAVRNYLIKSRSNLYVIYRIIAKWTGANHRFDYSKEMKQSMRYIELARNNLQPVIAGLDINQNDPDANAYFDEAQFARSMNFLKGAIASIDKFSDNSIVTRFAQAKKRKYDEIYSRSLKRLNKQKKQDLRDLTDTYYDKLNSSKTGANSNEPQTKLERLSQSSGTSANAIWYKEQKNIIDSRYKAKREAAKIKAEAEASISKDVYISAGAKATEEFRVDLDTALENASSFIKNMTHAYFFNKKSHIYTTSVYNYKSMISKLLSYVIDLIRKAGNASASAPASLLKQADEKMEIVETMFKETLESNDEENRFAMLTEITAGKQLLLFSKTMMTSGSTSEVVKIINANDQLLEADKKIDKLLEKITEIPDWKGRLNKWGVEVSFIQPGIPYSTIVPTAALLTVKLPPALFLGTAHKVKQTMHEYYNLNKDLLDHNIIVQNALNTYLVPKHPVVAALQKALRIANLLDMFCFGFDLKSIISNLFDSSKGLIKLKNCAKNAKNGDVSITDINKFQRMLNNSPEEVVITNPDTYTKAIDAYDEFISSQEETHQKIIELSAGGMGESPLDETPPILNA